MNIKHYFYLLPILFVVAYACRKDLSPLEADTDTGLTIKQAKAHLHNALNGNSETIVLKAPPSVRQVELSMSTEKLKIEPIVGEIFWERAIAYKMDNADVVEVPFLSKNNYVALYSFEMGNDSIPEDVQNMRANASYTNLIIYQRPEQATDRAFVTYIPDTKFLEENGNVGNRINSNDIPDNFSGYMEYRNWDQDVLFILRILDGKPIGRYQLEENVVNQPQKANANRLVVSANKLASSTSSLPYFCRTVCTPIYQNICVSAPEGGTTIDDLEPVCNTKKIGENCNHICEGGGGTTNPPNPGESTGGGGSNTNTPSATNHLALSPVAPLDLFNRLECFETMPSNSNTKYEVTIHVHSAIQSNPSAEFNINSLDPGHAYITLKKTGSTTVQQLSFGFYPRDDTWVTPTKNGVASGIGEEFSNDERRSDIRYTITVNATHFGYAIMMANSKSFKTYDLNGYNCVHYAVDVFNAALQNNNPISVPTSNIGYKTPAGLYKVLDQMKQGGNDKVSKRSVRPPASTNCL